MITKVVKFWPSARPLPEGVSWRSGTRMDENVYVIDDGSMLGWGIVHAGELIVYREGRSPCVMTRDNIMFALVTQMCGVEFEE